MPRSASLYAGTGPMGPTHQHRGNGVHHDDEPHRSRDRRQPGHRVRDRPRVRRPGPPRRRHRSFRRGPRRLAHGAGGCHGCRLRRPGVHRGRGGPRSRRGRRGERRHHPRHPPHAHERGRVHERDRHQPHRRVPRREARVEGHAEGALRSDRAHLERRRALRRSRPGQLLVVEGRARRHGPLDHPRTRLPQHHRERRRAGLHRDRHDRRAARGAAGRVQEEHPRRPLRDPRRGRARSSRGSPATTPATSRAPSSRSTAASGWGTRPIPSHALSGRSAPPGTRCRASAAC